MAIRYTVVPKRPEAYLFEVTCTVPRPNPEGQRFALPAWIPGSYLIREFAKHVVAIRAESAGRPLALRKVDKNTWVAARSTQAVTVTMEVYAFDLSVRGAYLDTARGFFNGPCVFLRAVGQERGPCVLELRAPRGARYRKWRVATSLQSAGAPPHDFGRYTAPDYDALIDRPVEMGELALARFDACGVPHEIAIAGRHDADLDRLTADLKRLCETQIRFWHGASAGARHDDRPPINRYVFLVHAVGEGHGGLEHRDSTALLCPRDQLPRAGAEQATEGYRAFLGLASHEYFHAWNVKRIKPAAFTPYDLDAENYTTLLWAFEGITSYYDDLMLVRGGLIDEREYLELVGRSITNLVRTPGRLVQSLADASFDAWIKYYRQDENTPNAHVSYYLKGSLVALALDLAIRGRTDGRRSLDDVMRALWRGHGRTGVGVPEGGVERIAEGIAGFDLKRFFDQALRSTGELPLVKLLASAGVKLAMRSPDTQGDRDSRDSGAHGDAPRARVRSTRRPRRIRPA